MSRFLSDSGVERLQSKIFLHSCNFYKVFFTSAFLLLYYFYQCLLNSWEIIPFISTGYCIRLKLKGTSMEFVRIQYVILVCAKENEKDGCSYILIT